MIGAKMNHQHGKFDEEEEEEIGAPIDVVTAAAQTIAKLQDPKKYQRKFEKMSKDAIKEFLEEMPKLMKNKFEEIVSISLGFEKDTFRGWQIKEYKQSPIADIIAAKSNKYIKEIITIYLTKEIVADVIKKSQNSIVPFYARAYKQHLESHLGELAAEHAKRDAQILMKQIADLKSPLENVTEIDVAKPIANPSELENALLEHKLQNMLGQDKEEATTC